jgi:hypothetical protein
LDIFLEKEEVIELLEFTKRIFNNLNWDFWNFWNMFHSSWILKIPNKNNYNIREVIVLFFHEMTHFIRYSNTIKNLWFNYTFEDYWTLEEWIALYNEYYYWNKIIKYWEYNPYYDLCFQVLQEKISEEEKKEKIYNILKNKWFSKEKSLSYYFRFYRYSIVGTQKFFLKDLIYTKSYNLVKKLLLNKKNYDKIMSWRIWLKQLDFLGIKNTDYIKYFENLQNKLITKIKKWKKK